jgi:hypothetical protein
MNTKVDDGLNLSLCNNLKNKKEPEYRILVLWNTATCSPVGEYQHFGKSLLPPTLLQISARPHGIRAHKTVIFTISNVGNSNVPQDPRDRQLYISAYMETSDKNNSSSASIYYKFNKQIIPFFV